MAIPRPAAVKEALVRDRSGPFGLQGALRRYTWPAMWERGGWSPLPPRYVRSLSWPLSVDTRTARNDFDDLLHGAPGIYVLSAASSGRSTQVTWTLHL